MSILFERANLSDAKSLVNVQIAAFHYDSVLYPTIEIGGPPGYDSVPVIQQKIVRNESYKIIVDACIVGGIVVFVKGSEHCHLDLLFIAPHHQNRGIGTSAMYFIEETYPVTKWTLDTPAWAVRNIHFYEKLGYVKVDKFEEDGTPLIAYEKHSSQP